MTHDHDAPRVEPVGYIRSTLQSTKGAPRQSTAGAPDAWLEILPEFAPGLAGLSAGDEVYVFTWLHLGDRRVLQVHPRGDASNPLRGVFSTRSPARPNPIGLHPVTIREIAGTRLRIGPIEAVDGTPVLDVKPVLHGRARPEP